MKETEVEYDVVIIGSGLGGLACANILAREGKSVIVLERNNQIGGNLQVFSREKTVFDTGVHYIGGLDKGQNLYQLFKYFGIYDDLKLKRMNSDGFDRIRFNDEDEYYDIGIGFDNYKRILLEKFPDEEAAIDKYCELIQHYCQQFPLYSLRASESHYQEDEMLTTNARELIFSLTENDRLRQVFSANNALYAGSYNTPFYVHALVVNSYIESAWKCVDGGSQIAILMQKKIREFGGVVLKRAEVVSANFAQGSKNMESVNLADGRVIRGKTFISNAHPKQTIDLIGEDKFRKAYVNRVKGLKNTLSSFTLHLVFKPNTFKYLEHNHYHLNGDDCWSVPTEDMEQWPDRYMISTPLSSGNDTYAEGASIMCYMSFDKVVKWADTFNTVTHKGERSQEYEDFKKECAEKILDVISVQYPGIRDKIKSYYTSTPLTFRDYIGNDDGSLYGIEKDSTDGLKTFINPKTRVPNLYLTGANLNLHGLLGVSISALVTCSEFMDREELLNKINAVD